MKKSLLFVCFGFLVNGLFAQNNIWVGLNLSNWNTAGNWSLNRVPLSSDTVIFNSNNECNVDIDPIIASLRTTGTGGSLFSTVADRTITINNFGATSPVLDVAFGSTLTVGSSSGTFGISIATYDPGLNNAQISGTISFGRFSIWKLNVGVGQTLANVSGTIRASAIHSATSLVFGATPSNLHFLNGSKLEWDRDAGLIPDADFQNGSVINITGIVNGGPIFGMSIYNGLVIWNSPAQTSNASGSLLLPASNASMDSIEIINTGTGTVRLWPNPTGYTIGYLEVQGGTLELSSPTASAGTGTISTDFNISGGNVIGNATNTNDISGHYPMTLTVNGNTTITGGTFDLTNRPVTLNPGGAFILKAVSNVAQTGGNITATTIFGSQNQIYMNGTISQNLELDNITGPVSLVINNNAGVNLQNNLALPYALSLTAGYLQLNNFFTSVSYPLIFTLSNAKVVTNGTGTLKVIAMPASSSLLLPVAPSSTTYNPLTIAPQIGASINDYSVRVETGNNPGGIYNTLKTINKTWYITPATNITSNSVNVSFQYSAADANASCTPTANMELGHFIPGAPGSWNLDPLGSAVPTGTDPYIAGPFAPGSLGSSFVIGNVGSILAFERSVHLIAEKKNDKGYLSWTISNPADIKKLEVQRSADGNNFIGIADIGTSVLSFVDDQLLTGLNYYRLKMIDANGKITYSSIIALLNKESGFDIVNLYPTLVTNNAILNVTAAQKTKMDIVITDMSGRQVQQIAYNLIAGSNQFTINLAHLSAGTYQMKGYTSDAVSRTLRFVKQ